MRLPCPQLQQWWLDYAYLYQREPITPSLAFAGPFTLTETLCPPGEGTQCQVSAIGGQKHIQ